jgi:hypothetical protein
VPLLSPLPSWLHGSPPPWRWDPWGRLKRGSGGCKFVALYIISRIPVSPSWAAMERAYPGRPDSESGEFYV